MVFNGMDMHPDKKKKKKMFLGDNYREREEK